MSTWLYGIPNHPFFDHDEKIKILIQQIKNELLKYQIQAIHKYQKTLKLPNKLNKLIKKEPLAFELAIKSLRYGTIYWLSRFESKMHSSYAMRHQEVINDIALFLQNDGVINRITNYAIHRFILNQHNQLYFSQELIPPFAISSVGFNQFYIRRKDFIDRSLDDSFNESKSLYDLHDFSHAITASLNSELYGNHYFDSLIYLSPHLRNLIKSYNYKSYSANPISDGMVFSELSLCLFNKINYSSLSHERIVSNISSALAKYYLNKMPLVHHSTGKSMYAGRVITLYELAALVQNKAYELPASEMEQKLFTRGGYNGNDPLQTLKPSERIEFLADTNTWLYFEARNTLRHRAHKQAYKIVANHLIESTHKSSEEKLLKKILENIDYIDFQKKRRLNLWTELMKCMNPKDCITLLKQQSDKREIPMQQSY